MNVVVIVTGNPTLIEEILLIKNLHNYSVDDDVNGV